MHIIDRVRAVHVQETTDTEENVDSPADIPVWSTAAVQADSKGYKVNIIDDKGVYELNYKI
jgi:hypothetical protein